MPTSPMSSCEHEQQLAWSIRKNSYKIDKAGPTLIGIVHDFLLAIEASIYLSDCSGE